MRKAGGFLGTGPRLVIISSSRAHRVSIRALFSDRLQLLGDVTLEPILSKESDYYRLFEGTDRNFKPYYVAHTKVQTLALLEEQDKGSNWCQWWRCRDRSKAKTLADTQT